MHIDSGTGKRALTRHAIMILLLGSFAVWFAWDGWVMYPRKNLEDVRQNLPAEAVGPVVVNAAVTEEAAGRLQADLNGGSAPALSLEELQRKWGKPTHVGGGASAPPGAPPADRAAWFVGPYGWAVVGLSGERPVWAQWSKASKNHSDIFVQKTLAGLLGAAALIPLALVLVNRSRKYVLDDEGLMMPGTGRIRYGQMTGLDDSDFTKKGIMRLRYVDVSGADRVAVLDEEKIDRFDEIVVALCERKGWPVRAEASEASAADSDEPPAA